jgi:hypothetical protein
MNRRKFIRNGGILGAALTMPSLPRAADNWSGGNLQHLIPLSNHDSILIKASYTEPQRNPVLRIGRNRYPGQAMDSLGRFWSFHASGLESDQDYELSLQDGDGNRFADPWPLRTAPAPDAPRERLRMLVYTCAGGPDDARLPNGVWRFLPVSSRQRLLRRALSFQPDLAIGIGDQVYWDQTIARRWDDEQARVNRELIWGKYGRFDEDLPVFGTANEAVLTGCLDEQIASLYGTDFRSVPLILTQDDHDYFENDEGTDEAITFPPRNFTARLGRAQQGLYFPEFLPDPYRPAHLAGSRRDGISESYGSYRWGSLIELLMYDCRRFITLAGPTAVFVEEGTERWMASRTRDEASARHLMHIPSTPFGWTAGKWGEWYPDYLQPDGSLGIEVPKPYWQPGWFAQHQRLLSSISGQSERIPLVVSGDLHAVGSGTIARSGSIIFERPINTVLTGPISTGTGWPSGVRGIGATPSVNIQIEERVSPIEKNGFTIFDVDPDGIDVRQFAWLPEDGLDAIDTLQPFSEFRLNRG